MIAWKEFEIEPLKSGGGSSLDHKIVIRNGGSSGASVAFSSDLYKELGSPKRLTLLQSNGVFALVPSESGALKITSNHRLSGLGKATVIKILVLCGLSLNKETQYVDGIYSDGMVIFPKERYLEMKKREGTK